MNEQYLLNSPKLAAIRLAMIFLIAVIAVLASGMEHEAHKIQVNLSSPALRASPALP